MQEVSGVHEELFSLIHFYVPVFCKQLLHYYIGIFYGYPAFTCQAQYPVLHLFMSHLV